MKKSDRAFLDSHFGQGQGEKGKFLGLPDFFSKKETSAIRILPVAFDQTTTYKKGSDKGPAAIIEASRNLELYDIETESEVYKKGIFTAPQVEEKKSEKMLESTYNQVLHSLHENKFVVTLGGEHSISFAPIRAHAEFFENITILQMDAHADLYPSYENNPYSHASVISRVNELKGVEKILSVGVRSLSSEELPFLNREHVFFAHQIYKDKNWIQKVLEKLEGKVYVTFDLDVFDSSLMPSTGTPEPGGLFWNEVMDLLRQVSKKVEIVGFDVVELSPEKSNIAPDFLAAKLVYKLLSYIFDARDKR